MKELTRISERGITRTGCEFPVAMTFDDWLRFGRDLMHVREAWQWAAADWLNFGKHSYGQKYDMALEVLPVEEQTLRNISRVGRFFLPHFRKYELSFSHYACIAGEFPDLTQKRWQHFLSVAERDSLSVADMRELIRGDIAEFPRSDDDKIKAGPSDWANRLSLWARQQEHLEEWSLERVRAVESDLRAVGELHRKLQARLEKAGQRALGGLLSRL